MTDATPIIIRPAAQVVVDLPSETGEGPLWHAAEHVVYWVDIPPGRLNRFDPATGENHVVYQHDGAIGGFTFQSDGSFLLFCDKGTILRWHNDEITTIVESIPTEIEGRFNDVIAAPGGQVFCGTMPTGPERQARLYRLELDGTLTTIYSDIGLSNGMGFSHDERTMFYTDTNARVIYRIDIDPVTGELANRQAIVRTPEGEGVPDGMAVDAKGNLWSARWGGSALFHYLADGTLIGKVELPVRRISSVAFGGEGLATAYVTTAGGPERGEVEGAFAGSLLAIDLGVAGRPGFQSRVLVED